MVKKKCVNFKKKCSYCGSKENYKNSSKLDIRAIEFKHTNQLKSFPKNITWLPSEGISTLYLDPIFSRRLCKSQSISISKYFKLFLGGQNFPDTLPVLLDSQSDFASSEKRCISFEESVRARELSKKRETVKSKRRTQFAMEPEGEDQISQQ